MTESIVLRVRIKRYSPLEPYSFHDKVANKEYDAILTDTGMYAVQIGQMNPNHKQGVWAFDPREVEVIK